MAIKKSIDKYANVAATYVEATVGGLGSTLFSFPYSITDKIAILINRIEYWFEDFSLFNSTADVYRLGLGVRVVSDMTVQSDPALIDTMDFRRLDLGAAASGSIINNPIIKDFSTLPNGGILVSPSPLYALAHNIGLSATAGAWIKFYYTYLEMATEDFWQLVESRRVVS